MEGRRVPATKNEFERLCDFFEERPFMAQCGSRHRMEKNITPLQNGESEGNDGISETKMLCEEDKRARCTREAETGGQGNVRSKLKLCHRVQRNLAEVCSSTCDKRSNAVVAQDGRPHSIAQEISTHSGSHM